MLDLFRNPKKFAALIVFKVGVAGLVISAYQGWIHIGDLPLSAAVDSKESEKAAKPTASTDSASKTEAVESEGKPQPSRKSFLFNLLELPKIEPDKIKKDELATYMSIIERKQKQIEDRISMITNREGQLKKLESSIDDKLKRLDEERRFFGQTIQQEKDLKGERLDKLVTLYAKMEPKKASPVFEKLDRDLVVELFKQIPQKQITLILEAMPPERSVYLSEYYGRVKSAKEYDLLKEMNTSLRKEFDECKGMPKEQ